MRNVFWSTIWLVGVKKLKHLILSKRKGSHTCMSVYVQIFDKEQNFLQGTFTTKVSAQYSIIYGNFIQKPSSRSKINWISVYRVLTLMPRTSCIVKSFPHVCVCVCSQNFIKRRWQFLCFSYVYEKVS